MFIERLSDEEAIQIAKKYFRMVDDNNDSMFIDDYINEKNIKRSEGSIEFNFQDWVILGDFDIFLSFGSTDGYKKAQQDYKRFMYRRFGKEYLDALDLTYRKPIEEIYRSKMTEHEDMLKDVMGE